MTNKVLVKLTALITAFILSVSSAVSIPASADDILSEKIDDTMLSIFKKFGNNSDVKIPPKDSYEGQIYDTSKGAIISLGPGQATEWSIKCLNYVKNHYVESINAIGRWGMSKNAKYAGRYLGQKFRKNGRMLKGFARHNNGKFWYNHYKNWANYKPTASGIGEKVGGAVDIAVGAYGFYTMYENPTIGYKSSFLEFCGMALKGSANAATMIGGTIPIVKPIGEFLTIADVTINNPLMVKEINDAVSDLGYLDEMIDNMNKYLQDGYLNLFDWYDYLVYGIEGDEADKLIAEMQLKCKGNTFQGNGVGVYKPNIYLYPEEDTLFDVKFGIPDLLTITDPIYGEYWTGTAHPDGSLTVDGSEYGYLFYESTTFPDFYQTNEGFIIHADDRLSDFENILKSYGFNDKEISDFTDFWCEKLESGHDYTMYPQLTETVDVSMPIEISPKPDTFIRIWFVFVKDDTPQQLAKITPFERNGFTAVEWGGLFLN